MQIKTTMKYHSTLIRMAIIKKTTNNKSWQTPGDSEEQGSLAYYVHRIVKSQTQLSAKQQQTNVGKDVGEKEGIRLQAATTANNKEVPQKIKNRITI